MLHIQIINIFQSVSSSSTSLSIINVLQSPFKAFNPSTNGHPIRGRSHRFGKKATWISAEIDVFLCSRSNVYAISSASFNATRPFCFTLVTVLRASTPVPTYVSSNSYVTGSSHLTLCCFDVYRTTSPRKSDSSCLFPWFSYGVLVCLSYVDPFPSAFQLYSCYKSVINRSGTYRTYRRAVRKTTKQHLRKSRWLPSSKFSVCNLLFISYPTDIGILYLFIVITSNWHFLHGCLVLQGVIMLMGIVFFNLLHSSNLKLEL